MHAHAPHGVFGNDLISESRNQDGRSLDEFIPAESSNMESRAPILLASVGKKRTSSRSHPYCSSTLAESWLPTKPIVPMPSGVSGGPFSWLPVILLGAGFFYQRYHSTPCVAPQSSLKAASDNPEWLDILLAIKTDSFIDVEVCDRLVQHFEEMKEIFSKVSFYRKITIVDRVKIKDALEKLVEVCSSEKIEELLKLFEDTSLIYRVKLNQFVNLMTEATEDEERDEYAEAAIKLMRASNLARDIGDEVAIEVCNDRIAGFASKVMKIVE